MFLDLGLDTVCALLAIGFVGGMLSGFIGSGGAFVLTPSMMSMGVPAAVAVASNMCHKFPKALVGAYKRHKYGQVDLKLGLVLAASAVAGVQIGIRIQEAVLNRWGGAGSNLYVSLVFVAVLVVVGCVVTRDAWRLSRGRVAGQTHRIARFLQGLKIPPMMHFRTAGVSASAWITIPIGLGTGVLAATIAVGGFIGVPGMIYLLGVSAMVASATELVVAFAMGLWASVQWGLDGMIDVRLALLLLATSLIGVQLGALGTTYVKDHVIKLVMGVVTLIVAVSRAAKVPVYLADLDSVALGPGTRSVLNSFSFWTLVAALAVAGVMISWALITGIRRARQGQKPEHDPLVDAEPSED
ncbi:MAG TPA: sulfite exporter TauE/SafE family protein [Planctomycetota bacterium]|nr:sulfite exporter TauE/SafE family protein [Planctomycetota bacterium]